MRRQYFSGVSALAVALTIGALTIAFGATTPAFANDAAMNKAGNLAGPFGGDPEAATKDVRAFLSEYERFADSWSL